MLDAMNLVVLVGAGLVVISILTSLISLRIGAPLLLIFLGIGLLAGEDGVLGIDFDDGGAAYFIGSLALAVILFDSGFETRLASVRQAAWPALALATVGVLATTALTGAAAHWLLGLPWAQSLLMGAIVSSTDAAAVFFLLRVGGITLRDRIRSTLEVESGSNDPMAIFLTITLIELIVRDAPASMLTGELLQAFGVQMGIGLVAGVAGGFAISRIVNAIDLDTGLYPVLVGALALCLFAATGMVGGSGFLAVYVAGLVVGNGRVRVANALRRFQGGMTWLAQIAMFLTLGLLATPSQFPEYILPATALALFLIFVARPLAVWLCLLPFGFSRNETAFAAWVGLRGAVSILLAILPVVGGLSQGAVFFNVAFVVVVVSLLVQGWTVRPMARWLGLIVPPRVGPVERVELELPGGASHELIGYRIPEGSPVAEGERLPRWARPSLIVRGNQSMRLHQAGRLQAGDFVYIFAPHRQAALLDRLFAGKAKLDPDDKAFYGDFNLAPDAPVRTLAATYGFEPDRGDEALTIREVLGRAFSGRVEVGDRLHYGPVELIVRDVGEDGSIEEVGLALEPAPRHVPKLPLFQSSRELRAVLARLLRRRSKPAAVPTGSPSARKDNGADPRSESSGGERDEAVGGRRQQGVEPGAAL